MTLDNILEEIKKAESILILTHESPDGDAIGSSLAVNLALKQLGKNPEVIIREFPRTFEFLPGSNDRKIEAQKEKYDLIITLDCADQKRLVGKEYIERANKIINIDHHGSNTMYGDINFINPVAPACCEILIGMLEYFDIPINVEIGTANYTSNYKVKVGDTLYVTSDRLSVMFEPNEQSEKLATLSKNDEIKLLQIDGEWYKIKNNITQGYVRAECTTYLNPNQKLEEESNTSQDTGASKTKQQLISTLRFDMALNKPSGLSLEQFKKVLSDSKDTNKIFEKNAEYFYYIEKQYNINGIFVAAVGIHESAWGTSKIATSKMNLFGYGAYDSNPYNGAYHFSNYSECIDLIARVFVKYYLNPKGTEIYGGEKAQGTYYNGATLSGVNTKYATDKNWANGVYSHMKYLYNKL